MNVSKWRPITMDDAKAESGEEFDVRDSRGRLDRLVSHAAHLLPAQGPISVFVHHNTLHAFEDERFERAVVVGGERLGCEPFLSEERYRQELARGRILAADLRGALEEDLGEAGAQRVAGLVPRIDLRMAMVEHLFTEPSGAELAWLLAETRVLDHLRRDLLPDVRRRLLGRARAAYGRDRGEAAVEREIVRGIWAAARAIAEQAPPPVSTARLAPARLRDLVLAAEGVDVDEEVHPLLIRLAAAFLDQGIAYWPLPARERGFYGAFLELYGEGVRGARWTAALRAAIADEVRAGGDALASIERSLAAMGIAEAAQEEVITASLLALRGWAGMFWQIERRPDRVPVHAPPARLADFLAVRLVIERAVLTSLARERLGHRGPLAALWPLLSPRLPAAPARSVEARAAGLFQVAQALGLDGAILAGLERGAAAELLGEIEAFSATERRRIFHLAYERRHRHEILDALHVHAGAPARAAATPSFQAVFCIDEREESMRRHLEEVEPSCETFGYAGFFGVAMYYRGAEDAHPVPLCPIVIRPEHAVEEVVDEGASQQAELRARGRRAVGRLSRGVAVGTRTFARGTLITAGLGVLAVVPLISRVLFPRLTARLRRRGEGLMRAPRQTHLALDRGDAPPRLGRYSGFTKEEMAATVRRVLEECGLAGRLAPLVLIVGHGSGSLNNPHWSAYECGACGGGSGGANARAFAQMANDPEVRALLAAQGLEIPAETWFVGAIHNTCDDAVIYYDLERAPEAARPHLARARKAVDAARAYNAHERCRRFMSAPLWMPPVLALAHVEARAQDLSQVRAELGHATNAVCLVGRRARTRGLFLDRRAFLVSYDPTRDPDASILGRLLGAVVPVCAGINLEYYFSHVDSAGYGCGSKLPHNVSGLVGVMDGAGSDLRTGLPWQMVELHEPVRLLMVIEAAPAAIERVLAASPGVRRTIEGGWIRLAVLDPEGPGIQVYRGGRFERHVPESLVLATAPSSAAWYRGRRDHLPCARIVDAEGGA